MNINIRQTLRRALVVLTTGMLCISVAAVCAFAADPPQGNEFNEITFWEWTRVDSQSDLPTDTPKVEVKKNKNGEKFDIVSENYDYQVIFMYECKDNKDNTHKLIADGSAKNGDLDNFWFLYKDSTKWPSGVIYGAKTFRTLDAFSNMWIRYAGTDSQNFGCKQYELYASLAPQGLRSYGTFHKGFYQKSPPEKWTIMTSETGGDKAPASQKIKAFVNVSGGNDTWLDIKKKGKEDYGQLGVYSTNSWNMDQMYMYVGRKKTWSAITENITVQSGQVQNIDGEVYVEPGRTITVEQGGVLSINGTMYNNGKIYNKGGTILIQKGATIETFQLGSKQGGVICCDGGDLILLSGARLSPGWCTYDKDIYRSGFALIHGATLINYGTLLLPTYTYLENGATIDNRETGYLFFGRKIKYTEEGSLYGYSLDKLNNRNSYSVTSPQLILKNKILISNAGTLDISGSIWGASMDQYKGKGKLLLNSQSATWPAS